MSSLRFADVRIRVLRSRGIGGARDRLGFRLAVLRGLEADDGAAGVSTSSAATNLPPPPGPPGTYLLFFRGGSSWSVGILDRGRPVNRPERELLGVAGRDDIARGWTRWPFGEELRKGGWERPRMRVVKRRQESLDVAHGCEWASGEMR